MPEIKEIVLHIGSRAGFNAFLERIRTDPDFAEGYQGLDIVHADTPEKIMGYMPGLFFMMGYGYTPEAYEAALSRHRHFSER